MISSLETQKKKKEIVSAIQKRRKNMPCTLKKKL